MGLRPVLGQPTLNGDTNTPPNDQPGGWVVHHTSLSRALGAVPDIVQSLGPRWPLAQINYTQTYVPYALYPVSSYADEVSKVRAFRTARLAWIDAHIDSYPH